jgi:Tfp pilus assembly protein PilE
MKAAPTKLPAFTIMETMIVMIVAAILIGFTYTAYLLVSQSYMAFSAKNKALQTTLTLDKLLKKDFAQASLITRENHHLVFKTDSIVTDYAFLPDYITRTKGMTDTFYVKSMNLITGFENLQTDSTAADPPPRVDDLQLTILLQKIKIPYHYHKLYSSENLFPSSTYAIH